MPPWLIAAGASLLGGVLSRQTALRERKDHFVNLRNSAQRAGFNPLTALRATMGGGYEQYAGILSRNPLEGALVAGANAYTSGVRDRQIRAHEINLQNMRNESRIQVQRMQDAAMRGEEYIPPLPITRADGSQITDAFGNLMFMQREYTEVMPEYRMVLSNTGVLFPIINPELTEATLSEQAAGKIMIETGKALATEGFDPFGTGTSGKRVFPQIFRDLE